MKRSIATVSVSGSLPEKLRAIAAAGFDGVEIFDNDLVYYPGSPAEIRELCAELGLEILLFQPFRDFEGGPRETLAQNLSRAARKFEVMQQLGCSRMLLCSNVSPDSSEDMATQVSDLRALAELAAEYDITVGYEALAWGRHVNMWRDAWARVKAVDHPALGIILDSFHILSRGDNLGWPRGRAARKNRVCPTGGRPAVEDGCARLESPFPLLPRPGGAESDPVHDPTFRAWLSLRLVAGDI